MLFDDSGHKKKKEVPSDQTIDPAVRHIYTAITRTCDW